jgi:hypothetical protein
MKYDPAEDEAIVANLEAALREEAGGVRAEVERLIGLVAAARTDEATAEELVEGIRELGELYASVSEIALDGLPDMLHRLKAICAFEYRNTDRDISPERRDRIRTMNEALIEQFPVKTVRYQETADRLDEKRGTVRYVIEGSRR